MDVRVLVVYDNVEAGKKGKELCDRVQRFLGKEYRLNLRLWNMIALQTASSAQAATETVEWPAVLIVVVNGDKPLPHFFKDWVRQNTRKPPFAIGALVVQLNGIDRAKQESAHAYLDLKQIAREAGIAFLSEGAEIANEALNRSLNGFREATHMRLKLVE
jgi:hypothetical protein